MYELKDVGIPDEIIETTQAYWEKIEVSEEETESGLIRHLTPDAESLAMGVFRLKSNKLANVQFNWKAFMFNIFPLGVGVAATATTNWLVGGLLGLRAIYLASGLTEIVLDKDDSAIAVKLHELSWDIEDEEYTFISVKQLQDQCKEIEDFDDKLVSLFSLGVARLDLRGTDVIMHEKVVLTKK